MENRRREKRLSALCMGTCHVEDEPSDLWRECAIIDVSTLGLGLELCHPDPVDLLGLWQEGELRLHVSRRIAVRLDLGPSVDMTVAGEVRNAGSGPDGVVRAGIEFVGLTETERSMVDHLVQEISGNRVEALGLQKKIADPIPVLRELPESIVEAFGPHQTIAHPDPVLSELPESLVEALGRLQTIPDPDPEISEQPECLVEASGKAEAIPALDLELGELPEYLVEALGQAETIPDPDPVLSELPEGLVEALGQAQTIPDPDPVPSELPESLVDTRGEPQTTPDLPGLSELARMGGELAFLTIRVIGSDVLDLVGRFPARPRIPNVAGRHARLGIGVFKRAGK